jgi:FkbM family methyltransferase
MANDDLHFRHYTLKHRLIAFVSATFFDRFTYTVQHGFLKGMKRKGGLGWMPASIAGSVETLEHKFWRSLDLTGLVVYDIGAFHGLLTIFFASQARQVVAFEPSRRNRKRLQENVCLNVFTNVTVRDVGIGSHPDNVELVSWARMPGGSTGDAVMAQTLRKSNVPIYSEAVRITTLDQDVVESRLPPPDFIKIDIEGMELEALRGAAQTLREYRPALFLEMHGETLNLKRKNAGDIINYLMAAGYMRIEHIETGTLVNHENSDIAAQGHLYTYQTMNVRPSRPLARTSV